MPLELQLISLLNLVSAYSKPMLIGKQVFKLLA